MTDYLIYVMFRHGHEGYLTYVEGRTVHWTDDEPGYHLNGHYRAPTYERALSKAKWLCKEFRGIVGRTEIVKWKKP